MFYCYLLCCCYNNLFWCYNYFILCCNWFIVCWSWVSYLLILVSCYYLDSNCLCNCYYLFVCYWLLFRRCVYLSLSFLVNYLFYNCKDCLDNWSYCNVFYKLSTFWWRPTIYSLNDCIYLFFILSCYYTLWLFSNKTLISLANN